MTTPWRASCYSAGYGWISDSCIRSLEMRYDTILSSDSPNMPDDRLLHALTMEFAYLKLSGHVRSSFVLAARWQGDSKDSSTAMFLHAGVVAQLKCALFRINVRWSAVCACAIRHGQMCSLCRLDAINHCLCTHKRHCTNEYVLVNQQYRPVFLPTVANS